MCTSIAFHLGAFYFGRNMDLEGSFGEQVVAVPRRFPLPFRTTARLTDHYALLGTALVVDGYPLFADAMNERGLCMAGLNFPGNAVYATCAEQGKNAVSPFELIPWVLGRCATVDEAERLILQTSVVSIPFSEEYPLTPLHWHVADGKRSLVVESIDKGVCVYDNSHGVLTNNPPFVCQQAHLAHYSAMRAAQPNRPSEIGEGNFSLGLGGVGLPGDYSSQSRFVKAAFLRANVKCEQNADGEVASVFDVMGAVAPPKGAVFNNDGKPHYTTYTCCMDVARGQYFQRRHGELQPRVYSFSELEAKRLFFWKNT